MNTGTPPTITLAIEHPARPKKMRTITAARALIGRETGDLVLEDPETSAVHAEIDCTQGHVIVRDLGSSNGTWRGAERLPQFALLAGQSFRCGATTITLVSVEGAPAITAGRTVVSSSRVPGETPQRSGPTAPWAPQATAPPRDAPAPSTNDSREVTVVARPSDDELDSLRSTANLPTYNPEAEREITEVRANPTTGIPLDDEDDDGAEPAGATLRAPTLARERDTLFPATDEFRPPVAAGIEAATSTLPGTPMPIVDAPSPAITIPHGTLPNVDALVSRATQPSDAFANATPPDVTVPNATMPVQHLTQPAPLSTTAPMMPAQGTVPTPAVGEQRRPPVANALIKPGGRPATGPSPIVVPKPPRKLGRILGFSALAVAIVAMLGAATWFAVKWFTSRGSALATTIARELPDDTLGFVAWASPRTQIELVGDAVPEPARKDMTARLGFDPLDVAAISELGVDPDAPMGVAWIDVGKPTIVVSFGVSDPNKLRAAVPEKAAKLMGIAKLEVSDRSFENVPALWIETPLPTAVLLRNGRATAIVGLPGSDSANVARHAERVAKVERSTSLAARPGFSELRREPGDPLMVLYVDGVSARTAIPGSAAELLAARVAFGEIDAMALTLSRDGPRTHLALQTVLREGTPGLRYVADVSRSGKALERIPGPGLAAIDAAFAAEPSVQAVVGLLTVTGAITEIERDFKEASNLDLRTDILDNIGGEVGSALLKLPTARGAEDFTFVVYASVKDEAKANTSLTAALPALQKLVDVPPTSETIGGTTVHTFTLPSRGGEPEAPRADGIPPTPAPPKTIKWSVFVAAGHLWIAVGEVDPRAIIDKTGKSLRDAARNDAIGDALAPGDTLSMYVDVKDLLAAIDPLLSERDRKEKTDAEPAWGPIEVVTVRGSTEDRIGRVRLTVHTNADDGFATLVRGLLKVQGAQFAAALEQQRRVADCARHVEHLTQIATTDNSRTIQGYEVRDVCESKATPEAIACAAKATTFAEIATCGGAEVGLLPPEPEPQPVPYVEDIWPNTRSEAGDGGRPRADVNYGVDVGTDAQVRGRADALVTIIEFGDFQCPYCREVTSTLDEVLARHGDDVRLVFRHNPLAMHAEAKNAAKAALAAARQGKFWAMHDKLFESQYELAGKYRDFAGAIGLDLAQFDSDFADPALDRRIEEDQGTAQRFGVTGTPAFFINGRFLSGGQPLAVFESVITEELGRARTFVERRGNTRKRLYDDMINRFAPEVARAGAAPLPPDSGERFTISTTGLPQRGATGFSRVSLIECGDFECPYCQRATRALERVVADYASLVTVYFMHNPLSFHTNAEAAARAAVAADKQGKFWEMHDKLYAELDAHTEADFLAYAKELKLDVDKFKADMAAPETAATVADQKKICTEKGGSSTPTFFLNGRRIEGAQPFETFKTLIDAQLSGGI